jgi:benzaldehyde dehydrogenase (NAD)
MCAGRHLVHRSVAPGYAEALARRASRLRRGEHIGPIIDAQQLDRIVRIVDASVEAGASVRVGARADPPWYAPTVLQGVTPRMPAFTEEIFGPVAPITAFDDLDEAVALAGTGEHRLVTAICTGSADRGLALADRLRSGVVHVNDHTITTEAQAPFGGSGASGNGAAFGGRANWDQFSDWQWVTSRAQAQPTPF